MKPHELPNLTLQPLATISPSGFVALGSCPLRAVWAAHFSSLLPRSPKTRIGTVIHHLWEAAAAGRLTDEVAFDRAWQAEIATQQGEMAQDWKEAHLVPLDTSVPDLEVRRLRCRRQLAGWQTRSGRAMYRSEQAVTDVSGTVRGRIDVILMDADGVHLIDIKTGKITNGDGAVKEEYVQQMKLYAALYHQNTNAWPASLILRTAEGLDYALDWTPEECRVLLAEALHLHAKINEHIWQGDTVAKPAPDICRYCSFRPACPHYWHTRQALNQEEWPADVRGCVENSIRLGNGRWKLRLTNDAGTMYLRGLSPERQTFLATNPERVAFYNLRRDGDGQYCEGPMTTGYKA